LTIDLIITSPFTGNDEDMTTMMIVI